jgi:hypothetical protein
MTKNEVEIEDWPNSNTADTKKELREISNGRFGDCPLSSNDQCLCFQQQQQLQLHGDTTTIQQPKFVTIQSTPLTTKTRTCWKRWNKVKEWLPFSKTNVPVITLTELQERSHAAKAQLEKLYTKTASHTAVTSSQQQLITDRHPELLVVLGREILDISSFLNCHPAGPMTMIRKCGQEVSFDYEMHSRKGRDIWRGMPVVGVLSSDDALQLKKTNSGHNNCCIL